MFRAILDAFEAEYHTTWRVLDAADYGVPQHRDRLIIVGFRDAAARARFRWPLASHAPPGELFGAPYRTVRQALELGGETYRHGPKEGTKSGSEQGMRLLNVDAPAYTVGSSVAELLDRPAPCITATEQKSAMNGSQPMSRRRRASESLSEALGSLDRPSPVIKANSWHEGRSARASRRPCGELAASLEAAGLADRPASTVQADPRLAVAGHHDRQQNGAVRLTVQQCAALQGFPADWTFTGNKSSQHRQVGNAVCPALGEAIGRSIAAALRGAS